MTSNSSPLVSTSWLAEHLDDPDLRLVDVRWKFRQENGRGIAYDDRQEYLDAHIPGAVFVGMASELSDPDHPVADMMVGPEVFTDVMQRLGISPGTHVVVYDDSGLPLAAARLWWALSLYGHDNVHVLDGGLLQWKQEGRTLVSEDTVVSPGTFEAGLRPGWLAKKSDVLRAIDAPKTTIIDCLANELYRGRQDHTWGGRAGHVPGAINIPAVSNLDPSFEFTSMAERAELMKERGSYCLGTQGELEKFYSGKGVDPNAEIITYCGRGIAASCGLLTLRHLGFAKSRLYDGSWAEWSADPALPVETS